MSENTTSQSQHNAFPFAGLFGVDAWRKAAEGHVARMAALYEEMGKLEGRGVEQTRAAIDESARMMRESLAYATQLSAEWRRLSLEATRTAIETLQPRG